MKRTTYFYAILPMALGLAYLAGAVAPQQTGAQVAPVRPIGVVTEIKPGQLTLRTDAGPTLVVELPEGITFVRVPPGAKDLKSATPITVGDIATGDRVLVRGEVSADQKTAVAKSVVVMSRASLAEAHREESMEWQRRGISGVVKSVDPAAKQLTVAVPNNPPTPGNLTHPVVVSFQANAVLLRNAPDSAKFSDAKPGSFDEIKPGDQVQALGAKSEDGTKFTAEKLVSGTFRNIAATVISVDAASGDVKVKNLANGKPLMVRTNGESKMHTLPQWLAMMIARFNSGGGAPSGGTGNGQSGSPSAGYQPAGGFRGQQAGQGSPAGGPGGMPGGMRGGPARDFNQVLERTPVLALADLKPGQALIIVSTEGENAAEVTAIAVLAGVEPILEARPKGSNEVFLGPWNMSAGGGGEEGP